jgi:hypothetical protein
VRARIGICLAAIAIAGAIPALAGGTTTSYRGAFDPSGKVTFGFGFHHHKHAVIAFAFTDFPLHCKHGRNTETGNLGYPVTIKERKFHTTAVFPAPPDTPQSTLHLTGEFSHDHARAHGTMRVFGPHVAVEDTTHGSKDRCDSGTIDWVAHRT